MKVYATYNIKGGVGKTSAAVNLAHLAALGGHRVLLWDLDPQGAATYLFRVRPKVKGGGRALVDGTRSLDDAIKATDFDGLDLLPADFSYRNMDVQLDDRKRPTRRIRQLLRPLDGQYDITFLDCPPSISLLSENVLHAVDTLLVPMIPATLSVRTFDQLTGFVSDFDGRRPQVRAFFSMVDRRKRLHCELVQRLSTERAGILATAIPALSIIEQMAEHRSPVTAFAPHSAASHCYKALWSEINGG
ncbi:MAG TPA: ParA family protein [Mycobacterium sp.]|jgi:cellulose biosynthesis protein BcsQ|uniref:ParA family protein n=1 Tax=Mycobacterium sp. TaxID=1785 RepID=UPI002F40DFFF